MPAQRSPTHFPCRNSHAYTSGSPLSAPPPSPHPSRGNVHMKPPPSSTILSLPSISSAFVPCVVPFFVPPLLPCSVPPVSPFCHSESEQLRNLNQCCLGRNWLRTFLHGSVLAPLASRFTGGVEDVSIGVKSLPPPCARHNTPRRRPPRMP